MPELMEPTAIVLAPSLAAPPVDDFPHPPSDLISEDGVPLESNWHRLQMNFLLDILAWHRRDRADYFAGGNMFIYYSRQQARDRDYRGPDFFLVNGVEPRLDRPYWAIWDEGGRYPDLIVELSSPTTRDEDFTTKFKIYEEIFSTREYVIYDPVEKRIHAWRKQGKRFREIAPNERGQFYLEEAGLWLGLWTGKRLDHEATWLRFFDDAGQLILDKGEYEQARADREAVERRREAARARREAARARRESARAQREAARADEEAAMRRAEAARADALAAEVAALKSQLQNPA